MDSLTALPPDLLQKIALHVPTARDVFSLSLVSQYSRNSLTVPVLFKWRLEYYGWDVELWEKDYPLENLHDSKSEGDHWFRIDHIHSHLENLFEHAIAPDSLITSATTGQGSADLSDDRIIRWLEDVSGLLSAVVLHHVSRNLSRLTQVKYEPVWATMFERLCLPMTLVSQHTPVGLGFLALGLAAVCHSEGTAHILENHRARKVFQSLHIFRTGVSDGTPLQLSSILVVSSMLRVKLLAQLVSNRGHWVTTRLLPPSTPLPSPDIPDFRWVDVVRSPNREMNFAISVLELLHDEETPWCGYYSQGGGFGGPMRMAIRRVATDVASGAVAFQGSGSDSVGSFDLQGRIDLMSGSLAAEKKYTLGPSWEWSGFVTPFGLVGRWGSDVILGRKNWCGGWWWIWPTQWNSN
ncbi:hypothetical protein K438DRAFT_1773881 [Mycena galopus ATCC 62051]|nr:hypothetical protein K438DRAFT_1773881 [Mycena galopus ATCC 62051]